MEWLAIDGMSLLFDLYCCLACSYIFVLQEMPDSLCLAIKSKRLAFLTGRRPPALYTRHFCGPDGASVGLSDGAAHASGSCEQPSNLITPIASVILLTRLLKELQKTLYSEAS